MAINYSDLFTKRLKSIVTAVNTVNGWYTELSTIESDINTKLVSASSQNLLGIFLSQVDLGRSSTLGVINSLASLANNVLQDRDTILVNLPQVSSNSIDSILSAIIKEMNDNSDSVLNSTVTIGTITKTTTNTNTGSLFTSKLLDGVSNPAYYSSAKREYAGVTSELSLTSDSLVVTCVQDSETDGLTWGRERFQITGKPRSGSLFSWQSKGSGGPTSCSTAQAESVADLSFDAFTSNVPNGWTVVSGTAGTHFSEETTEVVNTGSSLLIEGNCELSIPVTLGTLTHYLGGFLIKSDGLVSGAVLNIFLEGTGYTTEGSDEISMDATALNAQTAFGVESFNTVTPATLPDNLTLRIEVTSMSAGSIYIDFGFLSRPVYHDGIAILPIAGREVYLRGDKFTFNVTNNDAGEYQKFFRDAFGVQLPSDASPTLAY